MGLLLWVCFVSVSALSHTPALSLDKIEDGLSSPLQDGKRDASAIFVEISKSDLVFKGKSEKRLLALAERALSLGGSINARIRANAVFALRNRRVSQTVERLISQAASDPDPIVRRTLIEILKSESWEGYNNKRKLRIFKDTFARLQSDVEPQVAELARAGLTSCENFQRVPAWKRAAVSLGLYSFVGLFVVAHTLHSQCSRVVQKLRE